MSSYFVEGFSCLVSYTFSGVKFLMGELLSKIYEMSFVANYV